MGKERKKKKMKERANPSPNEVYRHFKGREYKIITIAQETETGANLVIYEALYKEHKVFARLLSMFMSEVDHEKYPEVKHMKEYLQVFIHVLIF